MTANPFQLSSLLVGHKADVSILRTRRRATEDAPHSSLSSRSLQVRATAAPSDSLLVTASRDNSVVVWDRNSSVPAEFGARSAFKGHSHFVNALTFLPPSAAHPNGLIVSAGSDKLILVFDPSLPDNPLYTLVGHSENVCALGAGLGGDVLSGSWDYTAKVWRHWECVHTLKHHHSVWAVLGVEPDAVVTASADKTIKLWRGGKDVHTFTGHTDAVRGLALLPGLGFASCSNDATIRGWALTGQSLFELHGHTSFVYSIAVLPTGEIVSGGEDRTVRVWRGEQCVQTIMHPCTSVWSVSVLPNGDILSGGSDGVARVFTRSQERIASAEISAIFEESVSSQAIPSNQVGDVDKSKLPGPEALERPGKKDQDIIMVRIGNSVEAYQWSQANGSWTKIGEVVDAVGGGRRQLYDGKEYDYVFDIDIGEGVPPLKLPFNATENPYAAAQDFINKHELPQGYLDQIANFIISNAKGVTLGATSGAGFADPFTGGSRYIPGGAQVMLPFDSSISGRNDELLNTIAYTFVKAANLTAIATKIVSLNSDIEKSMDYGSLALNREEEPRMEAIIKSLDSPTKLRDFLQKPQLDLIRRVAFEWPAAMRFPGLDILRLTILATPAPLESTTFLADLVEAGGFARLTGAGGSGEKADETNAMLALRVLANAFAIPEGILFMFKERAKIVKVVKDSWRGTANKNLRVAFATLVLNYAVLLNAKKEDDALRVELIQLLVELLGAETDSEAQLRSLVALGTLIHGNPDAKMAAQLLGVAEVVRKAVRTTGDSETKLKEAEIELAALVR
ncbi:WD40-repeat-containing domain protein [Blyttiomyces helicus]|uniref:WD40-repeat-containing domain protein n=1 Tax=Blyttiomyces helicus TaxID=388810 RepID=A0A4P9WMQ2_9FUNG|nr:WD40-repeat-containing domain protein [Blyttiomyces helicus]|eukprot:RKO92460.1 WD40-repeat-containing domain protein [Blyttiomyces helicus]